MGGKGSGGARSRVGTQRTPEFIAAAVKLGQEIGPKEAAAKLAADGKPVHWRSIYGWMRGEKGARKPGTLPKPRRDVAARGRGSRTKNAGKAERAPEPEAPQTIVAEKPPAGLSTRALRRWHIERQIDAVRTALALAESMIAAGDMGALARVGALNTQLRNWLDALAELEGPEKEDPDAERARWRSAADRVLERIRSGLAARVTA